MSYQQIKLTKQGKALIQRTLEEGTDLEFREVRLSSQSYNQDELEDLTDLDNIQQTATLSQAKRLTDNNIQLTTLFNNEGSTNGFTVNTIGVYVTNPDQVEETDEVTNPDHVDETNEETNLDQVDETNGVTNPDQVEETILYGVTSTDEHPFYMAPYSVNPVSLTLNLTVGIGEAENFSINVNPAGAASQEDLNSIKDLVKQLENASQEDIQELKDVVDIMLGEEPVDE